MTVYNNIIFQIPTFSSNLTLLVCEVSMHIFTGDRNSNFFIEPGRRCLANVREDAGNNIQYFRDAWLKFQPKT